MSDSMEDARRFCDGINSHHFALVYGDLRDELTEKDPVQAEALEKLVTNLRLMRDVLEEWVRGDAGAGDVQNR